MPLSLNRCMPGLIFLVATCAERSPAPVPRGFWSPEQHQKIILFLEEQAFPIDAKSMRASKAGSPCAQALSREYGVDLTGAATYRASFRLHGEDGWETALRLAGFDPNGIRLEYRWNAEVIQSCFRAFHADRIPLFQSSFREQSQWKARIEHILFQITGRPLGSRNFAAVAIRHSGDWVKAVSDAEIEGLDLDDILHEMDWTDDRILIAITTLNARGISLNPASIGGNTSKGTRTILKEVLGFSSSGAAVYDQAIVRFGSWKEALAEAGISWSDVYHRTTPSLAWDSNLVVEVLNELRALDRPTHYQALASTSVLPVSAQLAERLGGAPTGYALLGAGRSHHGSWEAALAARVK